MGRLLQSAKKTASRNVSSLLRSAQKVSSHVRNDDPSDEIEAAIGLLFREVVNKGVIREDCMGLAVAGLHTAAKVETDPTRPFQVRCKPLGSKHAKTKVHAEVPIPRLARKGTKEESRKRTTRDRSLRLRAFVECLCGDDVDERQAAVTALVENRMGGFLHWSGPLLDVEDCIVVRERTGGMSAAKWVTALDTISKIIGKRIYPTQLMKKISKVEWGLLPVEHRLVEVQVEESKMAHCVFYWAPNVPLPRMF